MTKSGRTAIITFSVTPALKSQLEIEAWESAEKNLGAYIRGLLERRGKWMRSVGRVGGYDIGPPRVKDLAAPQSKGGE